MAIIRARYDGPCSLCDQRIHSGDLVAPLLGKLVHPGCKDQELAHKRSTARVTALPDNREAIEDWPSRKQELRPGVGHTRGIRSVT